MTHKIDLSALFSVPPPPLPTPNVRKNEIIASQTNVNHYLGNHMSHTSNIELSNYQYMPQYLNNAEIECEKLVSESECKGQDGLSKLTTDQITKANLQPTKKLRKRSKRKKKRKPSKPGAQGKLARRLELHKQIDDWQKIAREKFLRDEFVEENRKSLRRCLKDNRKRIQEATQLIAKLQSTVQKRNFESNPDPDILQNLNQLIAVWKDALGEYHAERIQLEGALSEYNGENNDKLWLECLFGSPAEDNCWNTDANLAEFVTIRTQWDQYLSIEPDSSSIPFFWVLPPSSSTRNSDLWLNYQRKEKE